MSRPLLLHVINSLTIGGAEVLLRNSVNILRDYRHLVVYLNSPDTLRTEFKGEVEFVCLHHKGWVDSLGSIRKLKQLIRERKPLLVHAHLFDATLLARMATPSRKRFLFTIHNILSKDAFGVNKFSLVAEKASYKRGQEIIAVSREALDDYDKWVGIKGRSHVLYNYVDDAFFKLEYRCDEAINSGFRLVAVGNLRRQKNYAALLHAFESLTHLPISLDIYGDGGLQKKLSSLITEKELKVTLKGRVNDIAAVLPHYHAYVMPSLFEGFGIAPMEAMATGMPVILSDLPVFREIAGEQPLYFDPHNPASIAAAIQQAYSHWDSFKEKSTQNKSIAASLASREVYCRHLKSIYDNP